MHHYEQKRIKFLITPSHLEVISQVNEVFRDEDPESALEEIIDGNLGSSYPLENVYKVRTQGLNSVPVCFNKGFKV